MKSRWNGRETDNEVIVTRTVYDCRSLIDADDKRPNEMHVRKYKDSNIEDLFLLCKKRLIDRIRAYNRARRAADKKSNRLHSILNKRSELRK